MRITLLATLVGVSSVLGGALVAQSTVYDLTYSSSRPTPTSGEETGV